jgi:16S rRNA (guanine966-N2)-methyltransferase
VRIIAGKWRGHTIAAPPGSSTRPTTDRVREAWLSALQLDLPGSRVLDLFAGSGALGLEALSRGAARATFVEKASGALRALAANVHKLGVEEATVVVRGDALRYVARLEPLAFDIALADPPYGVGAAEGLVDLFREVPFATQLWIEHRAGEPLPVLPGMHTRKYGDTALSFIPAPAGP